MALLDYYPNVVNGKAIDLINGNQFRNRILSLSNSSTTYD